MIAVLAIMLVEFTGPTGHRIDLNSAEVTSVREVQNSEHWGAGVSCVIVMTSGKWIAVAETCDEVRMALGDGGLSKGPCVLVCGDTSGRK